MCLREVSVREGQCEREFVFDVVLVAEFCVVNAF